MTTAKRVNDFFMACAFGRRPRSSIPIRHCCARAGTARPLSSGSGRRDRRPPPTHTRACSLPAALKPRHGHTSPKFFVSCVRAYRSCHFASALMGAWKFRVSSAFPIRFVPTRRDTQMPIMDQERWTRVRDRLRAEVGDDVYSSWFARMELDGSEGDTVKLSVPTRFLKSWIQSHYAERVLACWQAERPDFSRIELTVRSAVIRTLPPKAKPVDLPASPREMREFRPNGAELRNTIGPISAVHEALGGSPLDPRLTFEYLRRRTIQHARPCRSQAGRAGPARRRGDVQPALHSRRRRARQDPPAAIAGLGRQRNIRAQGPLPHRREIHVRLRGGAAGAECDRIQGGAADDRRAGHRRPAVPAGQDDPGRVLPHAQCAHRRRPAGRDRLRPAAVRSREPGRARALAARGRARGRDGQRSARSCASKSSNAGLPRPSSIIPVSTFRRRCSPSSPRP